MALVVMKSEGLGGLPMLSLQHESGASAELYLFGATITSFKTATGNDLLFTSKEAVYDGKKPIRGGIPLVFPQFGGGELPSHGFARRSNWELVEGEGCVLRLSDSEGTRAMWPHAFVLLYSIVLSADGLETTLIVENTGETSFDFQALLHTYYSIDNINAITVRGLKSVSFVDKMAEAARFEEDRDLITIGQEVDRVYESAPSEVTIHGVSATIPHVSVRIEASSAAAAGESATVEEHDVVLWNPWTEKAARTADFGDDEFPAMLCLEPGYVSRWQPLQPRAQWALKQSITVTEEGAPAAAAAAAGEGKQEL